MALPRIARPQAGGEPERIRAAFGELREADAFSTALRPMPAAEGTAERLPVRRCPARLVRWSRAGPHD